MNALICELCGSNDIVKQGGYFVCQHCGTKYTVEEAKKILGTVKIDKTDDVKKLLVLARRAKKEKNDEKADKYYEMVIMEDPENWEAVFFQMCYSAQKCKISEIEQVVNRVANSYDKNIRRIKDISDEAERSVALNTIVDDSISLVAVLQQNSLSYYMKHSNVLIEHCSRLTSFINLYLALEKALKAYFPDEKIIICHVQKEVYGFINRYALSIHTQRDKLINISNRLFNEIIQIDNSFIVNKRPDGKKKNGCYVATAIYGSYDCPQVWTLRRFRDHTLAETWYGRAFIYAYYAISPTIVRWFGKTEWFSCLLKPSLDKLVESLNAKGVVSTPYQDRQW